MKTFTKMSSDGVGFQKLIQTGQLDVYDYGTGFIDLIITPYVDIQGINHVKIYFSTLDDSDITASVKVKTREKAKSLTHRIANEVFRDMVAFPSREELESILTQYGMHIH